MARNGRAESATSGARSRSQGWRGRIAKGRADDVRALAREHAQEVMSSRARANLSTSVPGTRAPVTRSVVRDVTDLAARFRGTETQHGGE
jgi:hypothetical protein